MPLLCPALSREHGWSCCQWDDEAKRQEQPVGHMRGTGSPHSCCGGDRDVGLGVGLPLSCGQAITLGQTAPLQL